MPESSSQQRRIFLSGLMKLLVFIGFIFLSIPFISSLSTNNINEKLSSSSRWIISTSVEELVVGQVKHYRWAGGLVWVYTRTENEIRSLKTENTALRDTASEKSDQPAAMKNKFRSASEKFFVFIPLENKKGCQIRMTSEPDNVRFTEPCYTSEYDAAGRIFKNKGHQEQLNLAVPEHIIEDGILKIGVWMPKIKR